MADFILLATADWDHPLWTNKQHVAVALAELGHRVLYVESLGLRGARSDRTDRRRILRRLRRALLPPRRVREGLWVWSPLVMPGGTMGLPLRLNRLSMRVGLALAQLWVGLRLPLLWSFNPLVRDYLPMEGFQGTIYHCVDRVQAQPGMPAERLETAERELCRQVDVVFTTAPRLQEALQPLNPATYLFGNVADDRHFAQARGGSLVCPPELRGLEPPLLLFVGAIDAYKLDLDLLEELARVTPAWTYVLIGPVGETDPSTDVSALRRLANVHLPGPRPYGELPSYLARADVALLPLRLNAYTRHMFPMKFFEYLAAGCPIVATAIPSLHDQGDMALLCEPEVGAFRRAIETILAGDGPDLETRLQRASLHTYRRRTTAMIELLDLHGLLPDCGVDAPPRRRLRQYWPDWMAAQPPVLLVRGLERLGGERQALALLAFLQRRWPRNPALLAALAPRLVAQGDYARGRQLIEDLWIETADTRYLHRLLFRRGARPSSKSDQLRLFATLAESAILPSHFTGYCRVVLTYRATDFKDEEAIRASLSPLEELIQRLEGDPGTYRCLRPNRENRAKLLVSAQLARLRACLALREWAGLDAGARRLMVSAERYRPEAIDPDSAARMTRNILRCLAFEAMMSWHARDGGRFGRALDQMQRLWQASERPELDPYILATQEDHRGFAAEMVRQLKPCRWPEQSPELRPEFECLLGAIILVIEPRLDWNKAEKARRVFGGLTAAA